MKPATSLATARYENGAHPASSIDKDVSIGMIVVMH